MAAPVDGFDEEAVFPQSLLMSEGATLGQDDRVVITQTASGAETRVILWDGGKKYYRIPMNQRTPAMMEELRTFLRARRGPGYGFRLRDPDDHSVDFPTDTLALTATTFQLVKRYDDGVRVSVWPVYKPVPGTVRVFNGAVEEFGWTVDTATGVVTFPAPPGFTPKALFEFHVPVRFLSNEMRYVYTHVNQRDWGDVEMVEDWA